MKHGFFVLYLFLITFISQTSVNARPFEDTISEADLEKASEFVVNTYREFGITGLEIAIEDCYKENIENHFYCLYLDLGARHIEQVMVVNMALPPENFFSDEKFGPRIAPVFIGAGMDMDTANHFLYVVTPLINDMTDDLAAKKR